MVDFLGIVLFAGLLAASALVILVTLLTFVRVWFLLPRFPLFHPQFLRKLRT